MSLIVYKDELADDSVAKFIQNTKIQISSTIFPIVTQGVQKAIAKRLSKIKTYADRSEDLFSIYSLLATSTWNKNDDIFTKEDLWLAKETPVDKPFNVEHIPDKIIGHTVASWLVDDDMEELDEDAAIDSLPNKFHVLNNDVIYRHLRSREPEVEIAISELIEEIKHGDWCVSMECLFDNFDYAMATPNGYNIVQRGETTAFLTKYLRAYGGKGVYKNEKIGRVLRSITFSGKGLVKKPANPESVIFTDTSIFDKVFASEVNSNMTENERITELEKELEAIKASLAEKDAALAKVDEDNKTQIASLNAAIAEKDSAFAELQKKHDEFALQASDLTKKLAEAEAIKTDYDVKLAKTNEDLAKANTELAQMKAEAIKTSRINSLATVVSVEEAKAMVEKFVSLSDEQFDEIVKVLGKKTDEKMKEECKDKQADSEIDTQGEKTAEAAETVVAEVTPEVDATLATDTTHVKDEERKNAMTHLQGFLTHLISKK